MKSGVPVYLETISYGRINRDKDILKQRHHVLSSPNVFCRFDFVHFVQLPSTFKLARRRIIGSINLDSPVVFPQYIRNLELAISLAVMKFF